MLKKMSPTGSSSSSSTRASRRSKSVRRPVRILQAAFRVLSPFRILNVSTEVPNTTVFTFNKEDHTLGNLISQRLLKYDYITFSAYKVPHPLFATFELRVTTDGSITPKDAVVRCCKDVIQDLSKVSMSFQGEWLNQKIIEEGQRDAEVRDQGNY